MGEFDDLVADLKQKRDELRLQIHLASKEAQEEWEELEEKMQEFSSKAELKMGYKRVRNAIKED